MIGIHTEAQPGNDLVLGIDEVQAAGGSVRIDEERQRNREDAVANPFCPVGSIFPTGFESFLVRRTIAPHDILPTIAF